MTEQLDFLTEEEATRFVFVVAQTDGVMAQRFGTSVAVEDESTIQQALDLVGHASGFEPLDDLGTVEPVATHPAGRIWSPARAFLAGTGLIVGFLLAYPIAAIPLMLILLVGVSYRWWRDDT